jgi:hypothetical protein
VLALVDDESRMVLQAQLYLGGRKEIGHVRCGDLVIKVLPEVQKGVAIGMNLENTLEG